MNTTACLIGITLALGVGWFARWFGLDRDRAFYPTVMMVIAALYVLFAAIGGSTTALVVEAAIGLGFFALAAGGFKKSLWLVVVALVGHGLFDSVHPHVVTNGGVPVWWPEFCGAYDITAGALLGWLLVRGKSTRPQP